VAKSSAKEKKGSAAEGKSSECPMCGAAVPEGADECPKCEEPFTPEAFKKALEKEEKGSKWLFIIGVLLVLAGGPGVALGSWLHDLLKIPIGGDAFEAFGWLNQLVAVVGIIILVVGIIMLILSLPKLSKIDEEDEEEAVQDSS
jgi:hypothetical protein